MNYVVDRGKKKGTSEGLGWGVREKGRNEGVARKTISETRKKAY